MAVIAAAATLTVVGGLASANQADKAAGRASRNRNNAQTTLDATKAARAVVPNPYANIKDLSSMAADLSGMISNPYANIGVATQAAQMQIEEADIALANTLDTLRATGASAGGATALAQAALKSKQGVSSSIEQQEAANEKLKAQGRQQMDQLKMQEKQRIQSIQIQEGQRTQTAESQGIGYQFEQNEKRNVADLDAAANQVDQFAQMEADANAAKAGALTGIATGLAGLGMGVVSAAGAADMSIKDFVTKRG
jgi:hypothetical protein